MRGRASRFASGWGPCSGEADYALAVADQGGVSTKAGASADRIEARLVVPQDGIAERMATQQIAGSGAT